MLHHGLYEQVTNNALNSELSEIPEARKAVAPIDKAEASKVLAQYLADVVQKGLDNVLDNGGDISAQIALTNQIVALIQNTTKEADFAALGVDQRAEQLLALLKEQDPRLAVGKTAADLSRPETSIAQSSLFTGAIHEPQMYTELKKEIVSCNKIDMLVSFIKWSGLRLIMDELTTFTKNGGELRIITTSYMGATDVKAIEEATGVLSNEGGYSAHASVVARQYGKISLVAPNMVITGKKAKIGDMVINSGDYITLNVPYYGAPVVYKGEATLVQPNPDKLGLFDIVNVCKKHCEGHKSCKR